MITSIDLHNFKCFGKKTSVPIAPITLIYGENSAGKSSILQVLRLLQNSLFGKDDSQENIFSYDKDHLSLSYAQVVHDGKVALPIEVTVTFRDEAGGRVETHAQYRSDDQAVQTANGHIDLLELREGDKRRLSIRHYSMFAVPEFRNATQYNLDATESVDPVLADRLYEELHLRRNEVRDGYERLIEAMVMNRAITDNEQVKKALHSLCHKNNAWEVEFEKYSADPCTTGVITFKPESLPLDGKLLCVGLEDWIDCAPPEWASFRKTTQYATWRREATAFFAADLAFYEKDFTLAEFVERCGKDASSSIGIVFTQPPSLANTWKPYPDPWLCPISRDVLLVSSPHIRLTGGGVAEKGLTAAHLASNEEDFARGFDVADPCSHELEFVLMDCISAGWKDTELAYTFLGEPIRPINTLTRVRQDLQKSLREPARKVKCGFDQLRYLGPFRQAPARAYSSSPGIQTWLDLGSDPVLAERTNDWLKKLGVNYTVHVLGNGPNNRVLLRDTRRQTEFLAEFPDVGFGISQVLPIIVRCQRRGPYIVTIEQPELHIHPRLQAELGTLFASAYKDRGHQIIAETHSEHLLLRIQRLLRTKKLVSADVKVLYVDVDESGSFVKEIRLDDEGKFLDPWPVGFMPDRFEELYGD